MVTTVSVLLLHPVFMDGFYFLPLDYFNFCNLLNLFFFGKGMGNILFLKLRGGYMGVAMPFCVC